MQEDEVIDDLAVVENDGFGSDFPDKIEDNESIPDGDIETEEVHETSPKKSKPVIADKTKYNRERRKVKELEYEKQKQAEEIERLRQIAEKSSELAMTQYDRTVQLDIDRAKAKLAKAIEDGDVSAQVDMQAELSLLAAKSEQLNVWKGQKQLDEENNKSSQVDRGQSRNIQSEYVEPERDEIHNPIMSQWLNDNPWFVESNEEFDPEMYEEVLGYATAYDKKLMRTGQANKIGTKEYFDNINNYVRSEFYSEPEPTHSRTLNMKQSNIPVAPVGNGTQRAKANKPTISLTAEEKDFAVNIMNLTEEEYLKLKIEDMEIQKLKGRA